jgi:c-di-AMP phosphodiesterase-like protein
MKKAVIIVISIGVIILLSFIFGTRFLENKKSETNTAAQEARAKSADAATKAKILGISLMLEDWYDKNNESYANFTANQSNNDNVQNSIEALEKDKNIQLDYAIASTKDKYVVRIKSSTLNKFYCTDSTSPSISESTSLSEEVFRSKTNCSGKSL